ncbi:DUF6046 domain-containing protein [Chryseobacterium limigenitum]|uniref:DUF6046 domain-containing protein n=1 Tax=Chryseobacterium limigenitum TaxID=1612149 RepID=A0A1K2IRS0_9FLAO|nr:DUF6046 domain-containing protein [Chryseobacterium limigenitum]SFZ95129.1 hypothetical protein SAMN05216324_108160 [Chryseobacterium limigenitum]
MEKSISFQFPPLEQTVKSAGVNLAYKFGMQTSKPLIPKDKMEPYFSEIPDNMGVPTLSNLIITNKAKDTFEFVDCIITINQEKNIVTTPLQGRDGTIKEYISKGDFNISIMLGIVNYEDIYIPNIISGLGTEVTYASAEYPLDRIKEFQKILESEETLTVHSEFLSIFKIYSAVIKSYSLEQETFGNRQSIKIEMLSDYPYEIQLKEQKDVEVKQ